MFDVNLVTVATIIFAVLRVLICQSEKNLHICPWAFSNLLRHGTTHNILKMNNRFPEVPRYQEHAC